MAAITSSGERFSTKHEKEVDAMPDIAAARAKPATSKKAKAKATVLHGEKVAKPAKVKAKPSEYQDAAKLLQQASGILAAGDPRYSKHLAGIADRLLKISTKDTEKVKAKAEKLAAKIAELTAQLNAAKATS